MLYVSFNFFINFLTLCYCMAYSMLWYVLLRVSKCPSECAAPPPVHSQERLRLHRSWESRGERDTERERTRRVDREARRVDTPPPLLYAAKQECRSYDGQGYQMAIYPFHSRGSDVTFFESKWDKRSPPGNPDDG